MTASDSEAIKPPVREHAQALLNFIDASPSPWHAVAATETMLRKSGFSRLDELDPWQIEPGEGYYVVRDGSSIIAFIVGEKPLTEQGFHIVGAHTDSPGLRVKPRAPHRADKHLRLGVEVYGGPILATFTDRDLSLAGRATLADRSGKGILETRLVRFPRTLLRLPNLAIHMNRKVNEDGLKLHRQTELPLLLELVDDELEPQDRFRSLLAEHLDCRPEEILSWELNVYDTQKGIVFGSDGQYLANSQLDNLASCHAAITAMLADCSRAVDGTRICAFFDHEEIGSETAIGADGSFLPDVLTRIATAFGLGREELKRSLARSVLVSADMAHAYHPNFPAAYEPEHRVYVNEGPVIKINANHRYTSNSVSEAYFIELCNNTDVPWQRYSHRNDIPCGSTIGPMTSARLGLRSVDVGCPMWAMHSIRESAGVLDHEYMTRVLKQFFSFA